MKARFVAQGAGRYVAGKVTQFDQKNEMFCRPLWDESKLDLGKKFYMTEVPPKDKPGYEIKKASPWSMQLGIWRISLRRGLPAAAWECMPGIGIKFSNTPSSRRD